MTNPITPEQLHEFAAAWFRALDVHAPIDQCWAMITDNHLQMHFPDADIKDSDTFRKWYERVISVFFDERHTIRTLTIDNSSDDQADLTVVVMWQASWWQAPAAVSQRVDLEATQKWTVRRCPTTKNALGLEIFAYVVADDFKFAPGSAKLPEPATSSVDELVTLNQRVGEMEMKQQPDAEALEFFNTHLSDKLIFRRAGGKVVGKFGPEGFLEGLKNNQFKSRVAEDIAVSRVDGRALVTLIIVATRKDDNSVHRFSRARSRRSLKIETSEEMKVSNAWIIVPTLAGANREVQYLLKIGILARGRNPAL